MLLFDPISAAVVHEHPLTASVSFDGSLPRVHKCISRRMYEQFPGDQHAPNLAADIDTSCDELESGSEDSDMEDIISTSLTDIINISAPPPALILKCHTYTGNAGTQWFQRTASW
jgi:hypothetical protein